MGLIDQKPLRLGPCSAGQPTDWPTIPAHDQSYSRVQNGTKLLWVLYPHITFRCDQEGTDTRSPSSYFAKRMDDTVFSSAVVEALMGNIGRFVHTHRSLAGGVSEGLYELEGGLSRIKHVLFDVEQQPLKKQKMRYWVKKVREVTYDVEDLLDEISTEALHQKVNIHGSMFGEVSNFFSPSNPFVFRFKIGHQIDEIKKRIDYIVADTRNFRFTKRAIDVPVTVNTRVTEQTHAFKRELSDVIGRDHDKEEIRRLVLRPCSDDTCVSVISIVGIGGLGKSTLARLVYNDEVVAQNFEIRIWVNVSDRFCKQNVVKSILEAATGANCGLLKLSQLEARLQYTLKTKKFLLILDDVRMVDITQWTALRDLLTGSASGGAIIVTTRSTTVVSFVGSDSRYMLSGLSNDECFSILVKCAFEEGHEKEHPELVEIGKGIVAECGGNPFAVRTLGRLLYMKTDAREWLNIRDGLIKTSDRWGKILPALRLSYDQLPSHLKQCFAYCSIFPEAFEIGRETLINYWMAQGFLQSPDSSLELEDIGNQYFNELVSRSFLQQVAEMFDSEIYKCTMHNLVRDLARAVARTDWSEANLKLKISEGVRHVSFIGYNSSEKEFPTSLLGAKKLRSFCFSYGVGPINKSFIETLVLHFQCLRVLDLTDSQFEELPSFVSNLKHLRFLRLSWNRLLKVLPNSICQLLNLQSLYLFNCDQLQDLPRDIGKLVSLRTLYLTSQLSCLPEKGLKGTTSLRSLLLFRCNLLASLSEGIQYLTSLRILRIHECPQLAYLPSGMKYLTSLEKLEICDCQKLNLLEGEDLQGLRKLRSLAIRELPKLVALPQGLQQSAATLRYLQIQNCPALTLLPDCLKDFTSLQRLHITNCANLMSLPNGVNYLTALQHLSIEGCPVAEPGFQIALGWDNL